MDELKRKDYKRTLAYLHIAVTVLSLSSRISQNHRRVEVGRDLWRASGPTSLIKQGHHLELVVQDPVQLAFDYLQGWRLHDFSGQPVPVLGHLHSEKVFPDVQKEPPVFGLCPLPLILLLGTTVKSLSSSSLHSPSIFVYTAEILLSLLFSRLNSPSSLSLSSQERCSTPFSIFVGLHWTFSSSSVSLSTGEPSSSEEDTVPSETTILGTLYQEEIYSVIKSWNSISL